MSDVSIEDQLLLEAAAKIPLPVSDDDDLELTETPSDRLEVAGWLPGGLVQEEEIMVCVEAHGMWGNRGFSEYDLVMCPDAYPNLKLYDMVSLYQPTVKNSHRAVLQVAVLQKKFGPGGKVSVSRCVAQVSD